jgi:hypothetical protein
MLPEQTAEATLFGKIATVMGEVGRVAKDGYNDFHKYDYVTEAALVEAVRQKLAEKNVALIPSLSSTDERPYTTEKGKQSVVTTANVAFTFVDGDTGAMFRAEWAGQGDDPADKGLYKAYTGALKYFLMKTFLIPTGNDPEADTDADKRSQGRTASGPRRVGSGIGSKPTDKQKSFLRKIVEGKAHGVTTPTRKQLAQLLTEIEGAPELGEGWVDRLEMGHMKLLLDRLSNGDLPPDEGPPRSDLPDDPGAFSVPDGPDTGDVFHHADGSTR